MYLFTPVLTDGICYVNEKDTFKEIASNALQRRFINKEITPETIPYLFGISELAPPENILENCDIQIDSLSLIEKKILNLIASFFLHAKHLEKSIPEIKKTKPSTYTDGDISLLKNWEEKTASEMELFIIKAVFVKQNFKDAREGVARACRYFIDIYHNISQDFGSDALSSILEENNLPFSFLKNTGDFCSELKFYCKNFLIFSGVYEPLLLIGIQSTITNPDLITKDSFNKTIKRFSERFHDVFGIKIRSGKLADVYAEAIGFKNGFQQLSHQLSVLKYTGHYTQNLKDSLSTLGYFFDIKQNIEDHPITNLHKTFEKINYQIQNDKPLEVSDLNNFIEIASEGYYSFINYSTADLKKDKNDPVFDEMNHSGYFSLKHFFEEVCFVTTRLLALFQPKSPSTVHKRPVEGCKAHVLVAIKRVADGKFDPGTVVELFESGHIFDGFEMAMALKDDYSWDIERHHIDMFDEIIGVIERLHRKASWLWYDLCKITPHLVIGDKIKQGEVTGICEYSAGRFLVKVPGREDETSRLLVMFEDAEPC